MKAFVILVARDGNGVGEADTLHDAIDIGKAAVSATVPEVVIYQATRTVRAEMKVHVEEIRELVKVAERTNGDRPDGQ